MSTKEMKTTGKLTNGAAAAAMIGAGIGTFVMGFLATLSEASATVGQALNWYSPVGNLSGKSSLALLAWLLGWALMNSLWKEKDVEIDRVFTITLALIILGVLLTFPPFFEIFAAD